MKQGIKRNLDGECYTEKVNRQATYESLEAFVKMILADNEEDFCKYYFTASRGDNGHCTWYYIQSAEANNVKTKEYYLKNKEYFKEYYKQYREAKKKLESKVNKEGFNFDGV